jgi:hypothetical protein
MSGFSRHPPDDWADPARPRRGGTRRLFDGPLSERSQHQALGIVSGLLSYLVSAGYLAGNPLALRRRTGAAARRTRRVERYLDHALWDHVLASVEQWPRLTARDHQHYERSRWLVRLLYGTGLRVSEAANAKMADSLQAPGQMVAARNRQGRYRRGSASERGADGGPDAVPGFPWTVAYTLGRRDSASGVEYRGRPSPTPDAGGGLPRSQGGVSTRRRYARNGRRGRR